MNHGKMVPNMKAPTYKEKNMGKDISYFLMDQIIKEILRTILFTGKENSFDLI